MECSYLWTAPSAVTAVIASRSYPGNTNASGEGWSQQPSLFPHNRNVEKSHPRTFEVSPVRPCYSSEQMQLLHHYTTITCYIASDNSSVRRTWQIEVPKLAFQQPFLLETIFSVAASPEGNSLLRSSASNRSPP